MNRRQTSFLFNGKTYTTFTGLGKAIAGEYFHIIPGYGKANDYWKWFLEVLDRMEPGRLTSANPGAVAAYNYCRGYYAAMILPRMTTDRLLDTYAALRSIDEDVRKLSDKLKLEAIKAYVNDLRRLA